MNIQQRISMYCPDGVPVMATDNADLDLFLYAAEASVARGGSCAVLIVFAEPEKARQAADAFHAALRPIL
jgi:hypothetical protein